MVSILAWVRRVIVWRSTTSRAVGDVRFGNNGEQDALSGSGSVSEAVFLTELGFAECSIR
jgi:hypothetical protein